MTTTTVYLDQNAISLHLQGKISLTIRPELDWIYSAEHFTEILRAKNPEPFLKVLEDIKAKKIELNFNEDWMLTGQATIRDEKSPSEYFQEFKNTCEKGDFDESLFDPLLVWINGGGDKQSLMNLPFNIAEQVLDLLEDMPFDSTTAKKQIASIQAEFGSMVLTMAQKGNNINKTRAAFGDANGRIGDLKGPNLIHRIWEIISPTLNGSGISRDQFFGFDPVDKQGYDKWPLYFGIIGCNAVLDILGYQAEKKCRKIDKIQNVRSDADHIALGAYCSAILSGDRRLINRAAAIYDYTKITTAPILIRPTN